MNSTIRIPESFTAKFACIRLTTWFPFMFGANRTYGRNCVPILTNQNGRFFGNPVGHGRFDRFRLDDFRANFGPLWIIDKFGVYNFSLTSRPKPEGCGNIEIHMRFVRGGEVENVILKTG